MRIPLATYRLQLEKRFGFRPAQGLVPYLKQLGISDLYASPVFAAGRGSAHGYDVCDPDVLNPELGTAGDFDALAGAVRESGLCWLQDIVPNHMSFSSGNRRLMDVLSHGSRSDYFGHFDIDWQHPALNGRLLAPFLGKHYSESIRNGDARLEFDGGRFHLRCHDLVLPLRREDATSILGGVGSDVEQVLKKFRSDRELHGLLSRQLYKLSHWKLAGEEINYRRFFTINGLISMRVENEEVFRDTHRFILQLVREKKIQGLRVDHIDGLHNPKAYLERLAREAPGTYTVVEKILQMGEGLPEQWSTRGTTGYDFLNYVNGVFCQGRNENRMKRTYGSFTRTSWNYSELLFDKKRLILVRHMAGELENLGRRLHEIASRSLEGNDLSRMGLASALECFMSALPVYRTYIDSSPVSGRDRLWIDNAIGNARQRAPERAAELDFLRTVLLRLGHDATGDEFQEWTGFSMRLQQFTGPLMAKGLEDTLLYIYFPLLSLNDVGGSPNRFGVSLQAFHLFGKERAENWPHALNATSTHDTKRGEDARARINVLSEIPAEWKKAIEAWSSINLKHKRTVKGRPVPERNTEYFIYQSLLGSFPADQQEFAGFGRRMKDYVIKAAREAKIHTDWSAPDTDYEQALAEFIDALLGKAGQQEFLPGFIPLQRRVAHYGIYNSLSQTLIKTTFPGVPDFYRGAEFWDLNLVDPDNRRPVDYERRMKSLERILAQANEDLRGLLRELLEARADGGIKQFLIWRALQARRNCAELFSRGRYEPVEAKGKYADHVISFRRSWGALHAITVAPRFLTMIVPENRDPFGAEIWCDTWIPLPEEVPLWRDAITGRGFRGGPVIPIGDILQEFPVALLLSEEG